MRLADGGGAFGRHEHVRRGLGVRRWHNPTRVEGVGSGFRRKSQGLLRLPQSAWVFTKGVALGSGERCHVHADLACS